MTSPLHARLSELLGAEVQSLQSLSGSHVGEVYEVRLQDGRHGVVKVDATDEPHLDIEGRMLRYLAEQSDLPVPAVWHASPDLLVMEFIESGGAGLAEEHAADLLVALHSIGAERYGFDWDTLIAGLPQPNAKMPSWQTFFAEQRLLHMARLAYAAGKLPRELYARLQIFAEKIHRWLPRPNKPGLIHGDVWGGNVLTRNGRIAAFIDPAIYFADPEIELAFITLFGTFGERFFARYQEQRPLSPDFFEVRKDVYNLYPLLVHVRLFGGGYVSQVDAILRRLGG